MNKDLLHSNEGENKYGSSQSKGARLFDMRRTAGCLRPDTLISRHREEEHQSDGRHDHHIDMLTRPTINTTSPVEIFFGYTIDFHLTTTGETVQNSRDNGYVEEECQCVTVILHQSEGSLQP
mmetsp:Transcript_17604/g.19937  ORF Transcript_17604/g.19937 Transcript_17604/m.19937 type:complete len:122 (+) Transcript_17604:531-896(+)